MRAVAVPDDVVLLRAVELEQAELGLGPMNAVLALGIASDFAVRLALRDLIVVRAAIIHAIGAIVVEEAIVCRSVAFPGLVGDEHDLLRDGLL